MLHTFHSVSVLQENADFILDQNHYNIFDSRTFKSNYNLEDSFDNIKEDFIKLWLNTIKPFLDTVINNHDAYKVKNYPTLIPEEGIYFKLQNLNESNISYFFRTKNIRLIGIDSEDNNSLSIFDSPVYDPLSKKMYNPITIILYTKMLRSYKNDTTTLNRVLLRIANNLVISYIDNRLMADYQVPINRALVSNAIDANKDIILLPESLNISDARFMFSYFYTLFNILTHILNNDVLNDFTDYSNIISLPDIFSFNMSDEEAKLAEQKLNSMTEEEGNRYAIGFKQRIYKKIWDFAKRSDRNHIDDSDYISICSDIMRNIEINLVEDCYGSDDDSEYYESDDESDSED